MTRDDLVAKLDACTRSSEGRQRHRTIDTLLAPKTVESVEEVDSECT